MQKCDSDVQILWRRAVTCSVMLAIAVPMLLFYWLSASASGFISLATLFFCGLVVNGPYALITTAVSADLGTQRALQGRARALATVTSIIDGTGSFGAALGPFLTGLLVPFGWSSVFFMLIISDLCALSLSVWIAYRTSRQLRHNVNHVIDTRRTVSLFRL
ncbi:MFS transporter, OPA family, solute carrier family 37, member 1/2 [Paragonimus westermani]|uniref:MFS transporter, OPA family, solute carrier family 37, member 1/2 n=1 Tax=Paragonimus westermani TaxID=34504 RepID=A0A5J4NCK3_9TREM|nr:MFS transporter, OPA family, solute carrier family 37, member 1/2 [Paragonimus westermani]